jgi:replicative DNA helicase
MGSVKTEPKRDRVTAINPALEAWQERLSLAESASEAACISAVLHKPELFPTLRDILQPGDFIDGQHAYTWHAIDLIYEDGVDIIAIAAKLHELDPQSFDTDTMVAKLAELAGTPPNLNAVEQHAKRVRDAATRLRILKAMELIRGVATDKQLDMDNVVDQSNKLLFDATDQRVGENHTHMVHVAGEYMEEVFKLSENGQALGVLTGFSGLDTHLAGLQPGEVTVLGGSEGMGKTTFMLSIIRNVVKNNGKVALFSLEMLQREIARLFVAMESGVYKDVLKRGVLNDSELKQFANAIGTISEWPVNIIDEYPTLNPLQLRRRLRKLLATETIDLVVIDGMWLMDASEGTNERYRDVATIMRDLNTIAKDFFLPILISHQYNGKVWERKDKKPRLDDFAESAGVRRNAQVMIGLYREKYYGTEPDHDVTEAHILKDRSGGTQGECAYFVYKNSRYEEV